jgi:LytS/YehU family sensor histidine kinase
MYFRMLRWMAFPGLIVFAGIVGAGHAVNFYQKYRERELHTTHLEKQLTEARLLTLQMQLQPHFFFNTLHSIASLVRDRQNDAAVSMIAQLSELLRYTLDQVDHQKVPLSQELEFIHRYLEIEQTRFPDRLKVEMNVEPATLSAFVPTLLLQPLVENAIKHGISHLSHPGKLEIGTSRIDHQVLISISNDGVGLKNNGTREPETGLGLRNARQRLQELYGDNHRFELKECGGGRVSVTLSLPFQETTSTPV